ncbi:protein of unknown function (plasmid) [Agreia sp. COWG]|nr:protein of unknown function [Agreia sp. COWG]
MRVAANIQVNARHRFGPISSDCLTRWVQAAEPLEATGMSLNKEDSYLSFVLTCRVTLLSFVLSKKMVPETVTRFLLAAREIHTVESRRQLGGHSCMRLA